MPYDYIGKTPERVIYESGGGGPGISDSVVFKAVIGVLESVGMQTDGYSGIVRMAQSDSVLSQIDSYTGFVSMTRSENNLGQTDAYSGALKYEVTETLITTDSYSASAKMSLSDTNVNPTDAYTAIGRTILNDSAPGQTDSRVTRANTWIASHTNSGSPAPTNPTNAYGPNNGTLATIKGNGGLGPTTSTMVATIPVASVPAGGSKVFKIWYQTATGVGDSVSITYSNTGGVPASGTVTTTAKNALTTPDIINITTLGSSFTITLSNTGALLGGAGITLDAATIETTNI